MKNLPDQFSCLTSRNIISADVFFEIRRIVVYVQHSNDYWHSGAKSRFTLVADFDSNPMFLLCFTIQAASSASNHVA